MCAHLFADNEVGLLMLLPAPLHPEDEHTLVLIKPDGYQRGLTGEILRRIEAKGYVIAALKVHVATEELLQEHYFEHRDKHFFPELVEYMTSGSLVSVVVEGTRVIEGLRSMVGATNPMLAAPGTIRGDFGRSWPDGHMRNIVHSSDSPTSADREIAIWFPELIEMI